MRSLNRSSRKGNNKLPYHFSRFLPFYKPHVRRRSFNFRNAHLRYSKVFLSLKKKGGIQKKALKFYYLAKKRTFLPKFYSFNSRVFKNFFFKTRLPRVFHHPRSGKIVSPLPKPSNISVYEFFPFLGINSQNFSVKHKYFYKRRSILNFFKYNLFSVRSRTFREDRQDSSTAFYLHISQTKNNLFFFLKTAGGRLILSYTNGQTVYKGSRRTTPTAAELAGKQVSKLLSSNRVTKVCLVFNSPITSIVRSGVRGLSAGVNFSAMLAYNFRAHNGMKSRATRRV